MKYKTSLVTALIAACILITNASNAENNDHDHSTHDHSQHDHGAHDDHEHNEHAGHDHHEKQVGPNGGRLITSIEPHLEFFVTEQGFVQITFLNELNKPIARKEQIVSLIGGDRQEPFRLTFKAKEKSLISTETLPKGNNLPIILSIKLDENSKTVRERFNLNLSECPTCDYKEYACTCEHHDHEGHDH
ncbi:MAG: hypothetical protein ACPGN3_12420 [Opitutales bacterium]